MPSDKIEKKRKRTAEDRHERPSKKPAPANAPAPTPGLQDLPPLATKVIEDDSELAPVIVTTPGQTAPRNTTLKPYLKPRGADEEDKKGRSTRNKGIASSELLLHSSDHPKLDYLGREMEDQVDSRLKHYVAVVDPVRKTWEFVEVRKVSLRGCVRGLAGEEEESSEEEDEGMTTTRAQRTELTNTFGTKQSRKAAQSIAENTQLSTAPSNQVNAAESAILSSMPSEPASDIPSKSASIQAQVQASKPLPTANLSASHPADVYPLDSLVPNGLATLRSLPGVSEWQHTVLSGGAVTTSSRYVAHRVDAVVKSGDVLQLQMLRYILLLIELARCLRSSRGGAGGSAPDGPGSKRLPQRDELRRILSSSTGTGNSNSDGDNNSTLPESTIDAIRRKHAPQAPTLSKNDVTFLHTTICALSLHIPPTGGGGGGGGSGGNSPNELATDPADLRDDLRVDNAAVLQYFRELGCRVDRPREAEFGKWNVRGGKAEANARRVVRLRVPVEFPKVGRRGGR